VSGSSLHPSHGHGAPEAQLGILLSGMVLKISTAVLEYFQVSDQTVVLN